MLSDEYNINIFAVPNKMRSSLDAYLNNLRNGTGAMVKIVSTIALYACLNQAQLYGY